MLKYRYSIYNYYINFFNYLINYLPHFQQHELLLCDFVLHGTHVSRCIN